jgi:hypothetical protein
MNKDEVEGMIKFLNSEIPGLKMTAWEYIIRAWNGANCATGCQPPQKESFAMTE